LQAVPRQFFGEKQQNMSEFSVIADTPTPRTRYTLAEDLWRLGVQSGMTLIVHSAMSRLGWVAGGPVAVIQALLDVLTEDGTLVMPAHSGDFSDPSHWANPGVPESWWPIIRETMPPFDPVLAPTRGMGRIAETFRSWPGARRSNHPTVSFAAWGKHALQITEHHSLDFPLGEASPLARLYDLGAFILLLGVGYDNCTSMHLGENRSKVYPVTTQGSPIMRAGERLWQYYEEYEENSEGFPVIGAAYEQEEQVISGKIGSAESRLVSLPKLVDFTERWLLTNHSPGTLSAK
jgi:aminoglycoside 3-N-acetyltransferase